MGRPIHHRNAYFEIPHAPVNSNSVIAAFFLCIPTVLLNWFKPSYRSLFVHLDCILELTQCFAVESFGYYGSPEAHALGGAYGNVYFCTVSKFNNIIGDDD